MKNWSRLVLAAVLVPAAMWAESLTPEKVLDRRGLSDIRWSPDGTKVAFVVDLLRRVVAWFDARLTSGS